VIPALREHRAIRVRVLTLIGVALLAPASAGLAADTVTLHVVVTGLKTTTGSIRACVFTSADRFPTCGPGVITASAPANAPTVRFDIAGVTPGARAVSVYVDANDNRKLDTGFMDIPEEPLGYSNNPKLTFGTPSFDDAAITVGANTTTTIKLKYF
jgi:uncharacterized protein (DUF2141 family)